MKKKHKILLGMLVLAGCLLFGCEKRRTELFSEEKQDTEEAGATSDFGRKGDHTDQADSASVLDPVSETLDAPGQEEQELQSSQQITASQTVFVHVCGAVENPGVYELAGDARVYQAVEAAGGFLPEACEEYVNQAGALTDGTRLYIPTEDEVRELSQAGKDTLTEELLLQSDSETDPADGLVNINTASMEELCTLPGIGEGKARHIISYRESTGKFEQIEDIMKVEGIKEGLFGKIRDLITAG
ncbi:helix-hairpin-helix domain-containing protein [Suilimivivens sp.]|uniref:helix-hairpin-helix domain-containing protein n=1 Tax=Suilimivivens sp. TaxID=2981669 RepID=UPI003079BE95